MTDEKKDQIDNSIKIDRSHDNTYNVTNNYINNNYTNTPPTPEGTDNDRPNKPPRKPLSKKAIAGIIFACILILFVVVCLACSSGSNPDTERQLVLSTISPTSVHTLTPPVMPTPTPTPIATIVPTQTPTVVSTPTPIPTTSVPTQTPTVVSTPTPKPTTSVPTQTPTVVSTPIPTPTPKPVGNLVVNTNPHGASIYIDDVLKGVTPTSPVGPLNIPNLSAGTHTLKIECENYQLLSQEVSVVADEYTTVTLKLQLIDNPVLRTDAEVADFFIGNMGSKAKLKSGGNFKGGVITASQPLTLDLMDATIGPIRIADGAELTVLSSPGTGKISNSGPVYSHAGTYSVSVYGVNISQNAKFTLKSGSITNNHGSILNENSDIVCHGTTWGVDNYGLFIMDGGQITDNGLSEDCGSIDKSLSKSGGVNNQGTFIMNGGDISGNYRETLFLGGGYRPIIPNQEAGGVITSSTSFTMNGGSIYDNTPNNVYYTDTEEKITTTVSK